jgi:hypothetical protein
MPPHPGHPQPPHRPIADAHPARLWDGGDAGERLARLMALVEDRPSARRPEGGRPGEHGVPGPRGTGGGT